MRQLFSRGRELFLLVLSAALLLLMLVGLELSQGNALTVDMLWLVGGFIGVYAIAHVAMCYAAPHADQVLLPLAATLNALGLVIIYRLDLATDFGLAPRQMMWSLVGILFLVATLLIVRDHRQLTRYSYLLGLLGLVLLALPLVWPQPPDAEARIWIWLGPFSIQPGEFSKILLLLFFAQLLAVSYTHLTLPTNREV